jgi:hypothetical protein
VPSPTPAIARIAIALRRKAFAMAKLSIPSVFSRTTFTADYVHRRDAESAETAEEARLSHPLCVLGVLCVSAVNVLRLGLENSKKGATAGG